MYVSQKAREFSTSSHLDSSSTRNGSFTYFNVLDIGAPEEKRGYQVSEQLKAADSKENSEYCNVFSSFPLSFPEPKLEFPSERIT